ncbi:MAG TPA: Ig domain-containing protein, partial [Thermoanaerobaculia bacterium]
MIALLAALAAALQSGCGGKSSAPGAVAPSAFSYAASPAAYTKGVAISPSLPHSSGGAAASYTISPQLPAGLTFDATSGVIAGTPTVLSPLTAYTVTAINAGGTASCSLLIAVNDVAPAALSYSHNAVTYTRGVAIPPEVPAVSGGAVTRFTSSPALPAGLGLDATSGVISGTPTANGTATFDVRVIDSQGTPKSATKSMSITVADPVV